METKMETKEMKIEEIKAGDRIRVEPGNVDALAKSIKELGLLQPLVVKPDSTLISGMRRLTACKQLGWSQIDVRVADNAEEEYAALLIELAENEEREDFTVYEVVKAGKQLEPYLKEHAVKNQGTRTDKGKLVGNLPTSKPGRVTDKVLELIHGRISRHTYENARTIVLAAEKEPDKYGGLVEELKSSNKVQPVYARYSQLKASGNVVEHANTPKPNRKPTRSEAIKAGAKSYHNTATTPQVTVTTQPESLHDRQAHYVRGLRDLLADGSVDWQDEDLEMGLKVIQQRIAQILVRREAA